MKKIVIFLSIIAFTANSYGQEMDITKVKNWYVKTDSIKNLNRPFILDNDFKIKLFKLEKQHPAIFFETFFEYLEKDKYDECAFLYCLGNIRYAYYNVTNKKYEPSGDGALFASLKYITGEIISIYLKNDIDKYIEILNSVNDYVKTNVYSFHSKKIDFKIYNELQYNKLIDNLNKNRDKFIEEWTEEREKMIERLDESIEEYNNMSEEEKEKLKN